MIVLMAKFCEPHYFYYPRIKARRSKQNDVPHLLIETEHEMLALENMRTQSRDVCRNDRAAQRSRRAAPAAYASGLARRNSTMNIAVSEAPQIKRANRLKATKLNNRMVTDYWEDLFRAKDEGRSSAGTKASRSTRSCRPRVSPGVTARPCRRCSPRATRKGRRNRRPRSAGYDRELCSYARTHIGCGVLTQRSTPEADNDLSEGSEARQGLAARVPAPDMIISAYPFCRLASNGTTCCTVSSARRCRSSTSRCPGSGATSRPPNT